MREAIICANSTPGPDTIVVPPGSYPLTIGGVHEDASSTGDLDITDDLTILGSGASATIIDASGLADRVFDVHAGVSATIEGMTITGGTGPSTTPPGGSPSDRSGGGILNAGTLHVIGADLSLQTAFRGCAIFNDFGTLTLTDSTVTGATSSDHGGAIWNEFGTLTLIGSTVSDSTANGSANALRRYVSSDW